MPLRTVRPNIVQSIRAFRVQDLQDAAQQLGQHFLYANLANAQSKQDLLDMIAAQFTVPAHVGKNFDALYDCMPPEQVERRMASGEIEVAPIAFMRGRTLADAFVILDEAQNTTPAQMKMFLTRFGQNSRMVVCGDPRQVDIPGGDAQSGLADAVRRLEHVEGIAVTRFTSADGVRHPIVGRIVDAYEGPDALPRAM